ncbi:MAG: heparinase II/III family protein [Pelagibacteraceae bacterium]
MPNLKSAYFYFLAIKINLTKIVKKLYYTSNFYYKSLESKLPKQFYFFPNSFLLSSIASYKNFSFKISEIDTNSFWEKKISDFEQRKLNSFFWLNLIDRKNDSLIIQKIITSWIEKNNQYKNNIWENSVISRRIISWILNADIIFNNTNAYFKEKFLNSIIIQTNHLKKNIKFEKNYSKKIEIITAILLSGLVFKDYKDNYDKSIKDLEKIINEFFDINGFPVSRNPSHLIKFSKYLILIKECTKDAQEYVPNFLDEIIEKNLSCIKKILTPDNKLPLFNGSTEINLENYFNYIKSLNYKIKTINDSVGGIEILRHKKNIVFFDIGSPPQKKFSRAYQSGPLSFEYYIDGKKIITNCGFGYNISKKAMLLSRLTSGQTTLNLNDTSVVKFERNKFINRAFGNSIKESFKIYEANLVNNDQEIKSGASHDAYEKLAGYIHRREIRIEKSTNNLFGVEKLIKKNNKKAKFEIRFHLYPGIDAVKTMSGNSVLIQLSKNISLIFSVKNEELSVEKSIFLGGNKILNNLSIAITGYLNNEDKTVNWEIKKKI